MTPNSFLLRVRSIFRLELPRLLLPLNESYSYDTVGNRTSSHRSASYTYQPFNKLTGTSTATYTYDDNGNLLSKTDSTGTWQYSWNAENQLKRVTRPEGQAISYRYDALGRRIQRTPKVGVSTTFVYDGEDVIKDINSDGSTVDYLNGLGIDDKIKQTTTPVALPPQPINAPTPPDQPGDAVRAHYYLQDHLGSTTALTDVLGNVVETQQYDSFGDGQGGARTRFGYTGRERDELTGLYYYRARWYDPQIGRFLSEDPIGLEGGINLYAYVGNSPTKYTDPLGQWVMAFYDRMRGRMS